MKNISLKVLAEKSREKPRNSFNMSRMGVLSEEFWLPNSLIKDKVKDPKMTEISIDRSEVRWMYCTH